MEKTWKTVDNARITGIETSVNTFTSIGIVLLCSPFYQHVSLPSALPLALHKPPKGE